jgi:hypothetical protein
MAEERVYSALILNDYGGEGNYADKVMRRIKTIETRMNRLFKYRGDLVICCGQTNSVTNNAGKALCIVDLFDARKMLKEDEAAACIEWHEDRRSHLLRDWRYFSRNFEFRHYYVSGPYQGIFKIRIPSNVEIITPSPDIREDKTNGNG